MSVSRDTCPLRGNAGRKLRTRLGIYVTCSKKVSTNIVCHSLLAQQRTD